MGTTLTAAPSATLPGIRKAAILLLSVGEQGSAAILRHLPEANLHKISTELARLGGIPSGQVLAVLEEFQQAATTSESYVRGSLDFARKALEGAFGAAPATRMMDAVTGKASELDRIEKADPVQIASFLQNEHPQTIALLLSNLDQERASALFAALPAAMRAQVAVRIARLDRVSPEMLKRVAGVLGRKLKSFGELSPRTCDGIESVTGILSRMDPERSQEVIEELAREDGALADRIRHLMFVFEDLLGVAKEGIKALLAKVDRKVLTVALKGTSKELQNHFTQCLSQRGAEMLREDMDALGAVRIRDVEAAQQQIIGVARQLESEGTLSLRGSQGDQYVV